MSAPNSEEDSTGSETADERQRIVEIVRNGLANCYRRETIVKLIQEYCPRISRATASGWISRLIKEIAKSDARLMTDANINRGLYMLRLEQAYALAVDRGDIKLALAAASALAEAQGVKQGSGGQTKRLVQNNVDKSTTNILHVTPEGIEDLNELSEAQIRQALNRREVSPRQAEALVAASNGDYSLLEQDAEQGEPEVITEPEAYEGVEDSSLGYPSYMYMDDPLQEEK